jgi:hypothetical protein
MQVSELRESILIPNPVMKDFEGWGGLRSSGRSSWICILEPEFWDYSLEIKIVRTLLKVTRRYLEVAARWTPRPMRGLIPSHFAVFLPQFTFEGVYRRISGITNRTGLEYHLPLSQDDQELRFGSVGLRLNTHLTNLKSSIPSPVRFVIPDILR